jgi:exodeoxyribonuclease V gamma subunit
MLRVFYSSTLEALVEALAVGITEEKEERAESRLVPTQVIIPNRALGTYAKLAIARNHGIAANLRFGFLESYLADAVGGGVGRTETLALSILGVLLDEDAMRDPELAPVREYLDAGGEEREVTDRRRYELASQLARLFREYRYTRRAMLETWPQRLSMPESTRAESERWQRALYRRLGKVTLLPDAIERAAKLELPEHLHVFGYSLLSAAHTDMLMRIGGSRSVRLYMLNPCRTFWQEREILTPLLDLYGRPGRESIAHLNERIEYAGEELFLERTPETSMLDTLANDVLDARPYDAVLEREKNIELWACPSPRRELEAIASEIWALVRDDKHGLGLHEIAVAIAGRDTDTYRMHASSVFAETFEIPHHNLEVPMRASSRIVEAIELLLALPASRFTRPDLMRLLLHPSINANEEEVDLEEWARWLDTLSVVHGADHADHAGTYIEKDLYNWDQGVRRLVLGVMMSGERSGDERPYVLGNERYLPLEAAPDRLASIGKLIVRVRTLIGDARELAAARLHLSAWTDRLHRYVTAHVRSDNDGDARDLESCLAAIRELSKADVLDRPVSFTIAAAFVRAAIAGLTVNRGQTFAEGVAIAPLSAIATIPFRVVFIAGLGEGRFPSSELKSSLDLRAEGRKRGDLSPRDEDEYAFLQRILATKDRLYLSWVSREARTGDKLEPSPVVVELNEALERRFGKPTIIEHPMRRYDPTCFTGDAITSLSAARERNIVALRESLIETIGGERFADLEQLARDLPPELYTPLALRLGLAPLPPRVELDPNKRETVEVPLWILRQFLEDPREAWKKLIFRLRDERTDDPLSREDETFSATALTAANLLRDLFFARLSVDGVIDEEHFFRELYARAANTLELSGALPTGVFALAEREKHVAHLCAWSRALRAVHPGSMRVSEPLRFGRARENTRVSALLDPITVEIERPRLIHAEITGQTAHELSPHTAVIAMLGQEPSRKELLRAFIEHTAIAALGHGGIERRVIAIYGNERKKCAILAPLSQDDARAYLRSLVEDLYSRPHNYSLPWQEALDRDGDPEIIARRFGPYFELVREES